MEMIVKTTYEEMSREVLHIFTDRMEDSHVLGFATGNTPTLLYKMLSEECKRGKISFKGKSSFNLDEYFPVYPDDAESYRRYMQDNLFNHIDMEQDMINFPDATLPEDEAVSTYKEAYSRNGPIDLQILGIGVNGHIAFNEPGSEVDSTIRIVNLSKQTMKRNNTLKERAITMGMKEILESRSIMLMASGKDKSEALRMAVGGDMDEYVPASFLKLHKDVTIIADRAAACSLPTR